MSDNELRRVFETVLTAPPPDTTDIDAIIHTGRQRRRRRTIVLSSAAVIAALGLTATVVLPGHHPQAPSATAIRASSTPISANEGASVTDARQLLGSWQAIELDGHDLRTDRDLADRPVKLMFWQGKSQFWWTASDIYTGTVSVTEAGQFQTQLKYEFYVIPPEIYSQNFDAVKRATEARLVTATPTEPRRLLLLANGKIVSVYKPAAQ